MSIADNKNYGNCSESTSMIMKKLNDMKILDAFSLKLIGIITMVIDHICVIFLPEITVMRLIGRISFPIYAFLLVNGFMHTSCRWKYTLKMFGMGFVSIIPYSLVRDNSLFYFSKINIFFTLGLGLCMLIVVDSVEKMSDYMYNTMNFFKEIFAVIIFANLAFIVKCEYGFLGIITIYLFYKFMYMKVSMCISQYFVHGVYYGGIQSYACFGLIPILMYNGKQGCTRFKRIMYWFYPVHLLILYVLARIIS